MQKILSWRHTGFSIQSSIPDKGQGMIRCPPGGGRMRIISFIEEPKTIDRIIRRLELTFEAERPPPPHHVQQELLTAAEEKGEYF